MRLKDLTQRELKRITSILVPVTCWECTNIIQPVDFKEKKRIEFKDGSQVILCYDHFIKFIKMRGVNIYPTSYR